MTIAGDAGFHGVVNWCEQRKFFVCDGSRLRFACRNDTQLRVHPAAAEQIIGLRTPALCPR